MRVSEKIIKLDSDLVYTLQERVIFMFAVQGYYDGTAIRTFENINAKPNQRVIITVMDEFITPSVKSPKKSMRGILSEYADPELAAKEKGAWERAMVEKYGDA